MNKYKFIVIYSFLFFLFSCNKSGKTTSVEDYGYVSEYDDGTYCAVVTYYNPNTGTESEYTLKVEVENQELTTIYWNNGGWLDSSHFTPQDISDGYCTFTSYEGYEYTVKLREKDGNCGGYSINPENEDSQINQNNNFFKENEEENFNNTDTDEEDTFSEEEY